jgi:T5orf172 domain.
MTRKYNAELLAELFSDPKIAKLLDMVKLPEQKAPIPNSSPRDAKDQELNDWIDKNGRIPDKDSKDAIEKGLYWRWIAVQKRISEENKLEETEEEHTKKVLAEMFAKMDEGPNLTDFTGSLIQPKSGKTKSDYVARRRVCPNFDEYEPLFNGVADAIQTGHRKTVPFSASQMKEGEFFIVGGLLCLVVEIFKKEVNSFGRIDGRLHLIFGNGTESNMLFATFQKIMSEELGRYVTEDDRMAKEFELEKELDNADREKFVAPDVKTGYIYVLSSLSDDEALESFHGQLYKVGVTSGIGPGAVQKRIRNAATETTYLCAPVKVVEQWQCFNINSTALETLLHQFLKAGQVQIKVKKPSGGYALATEWYNVPLKAIEDTARLFFSGQLLNHRYDHALKEVVMK